MAPSTKVFLKAATGNGYYTTRDAVLRSHYLQQLLIAAEVAGGGAGGDDPSKPLTLELPDLPSAELVKIMNHCEREVNVAAKGEPTRAEADATDKALIDQLEDESLLKMVGLCHRLGVQSLLRLGATRVAKLLSEASTPTGERAGVPFDVYLRRDPMDALSDAEQERARDEFIFTLPDAADGTPVPTSPTSPTLLLDRYTGAATYLTEQYSGNGGTASSVLAIAASAAGSHGAAGTGIAGVSERTDGADGATRTSVHAAADEIVALLGGEAPLHAVLVLMDVPALQNLKGHGRRWRRRCRTALCSGAWAEYARTLKTLDLGSTRHWQPSERSAIAKFLSDGRCARLETLRADGFEAALKPLLAKEEVESIDLLCALTVNPCASGTTPDALSAQSEFCALVALWLLGSSPSLRTANLSSLTYSGLLPLREALAPAVELSGRRSLTSLTVMKSALPVRDLLGLAPPPVSATSEALARLTEEAPPPPRPSEVLYGPPPTPPSPPKRQAVGTVELKWKRLGALDATLIAALLKSNRTLTKLDLSWNAELCTTGSSGAVELARAIAESHVLRDVDLSETSLGDSCAASMLRAVKHNMTLTRLNLRSCTLSATSRDDLQAAADGRATTGSPIELRLV